MVKVNNILNIEYQYDYRKYSLLVEFCRLLPFSSRLGTSDGWDPGEPAPEAFWVS